MSPSAQQSLSLLRDSLAEAQTTVRAYDTKAQIVGVGYIFALGIVGRFEALLPKASELNILTLSVACAAILPILLFGFVLYPSRKSPRNLPTSQKRRPSTFSMLTQQSENGGDKLVHGSGGISQPRAE